MSDLGVYNYENAFLATMLLSSPKVDLVKISDYPGIGTVISEVITVHGFTDNFKNCRNLAKLMQADTEFFNPRVKRIEVDYRCVKKEDK